MVLPQGPNVHTVVPRGVSTSMQYFRYIDQVAVSVHKSETVCTCSCDELYQTYNAWI